MRVDVRCLGFVDGLAFEEPIAIGKLQDLQCGLLLFGYAGRIQLLLENSHYVLRSYAVCDTYHGAQIVAFNVLNDIMNDKAWRG